MNEYEKELSNIKVDRIYTRNLQELVEKATPPTVEQVCEALGNSIGHQVSYSHIKDKMFHTSCYMVSQYGVDGVVFGFHLPPHLITLIGRFYEGLDND